MFSHPKATAPLVHKEAGSLIVDPESVSPLKSDAMVR